MEHSTAAVLIRAQDRGVATYNARQAAKRCIPSRADVENGTASLASPVDHLDAPQPTRRLKHKLKCGHKPISSSETVSLARYIAAPKVALRPRLRSTLFPLRPSFRRVRVERPCLMLDGSSRSRPRSARRRHSTSRRSGSRRASARARLEPRIPHHAPKGVRAAPRVRKHVAGSDRRLRHWRAASGFLFGSIGTCRRGCVQPVSGA